jgi:hypothetical protein
MERQAERSDGRRGLWVALLFVALLAGCAERPAYVISPDRSVSPYPIENRMRISREEVVDAPRPVPRPHYVTPARYEVPHATPRPRPGRADTPPPPKEVADTQGDQQSWWSWWSKPKPETNADPGSEKFIWPVQGRIIEGFGHDRSGERNDGINIAAADGTPIRAAASGTVTYTGNELKGYGNLVLIKHSGGYVTAYAHAGSIKVGRGDVVAKGQIIGTTGATGDVDRPQLHFEIRKGVQAVDPEHYLVSDRAS